MTNVMEAKTYRAGSIHKRFCARLLTATALQLLAMGAAMAQDAGIEEVVVTANRREESLSKVPISVAAYTNEAMEAQGIKALSDLTRLTPGLVVSNDQQNSANSISIRGIASSAGSATTGIYIDDVPIQAAALGTGGYGQIYPVVFDLERVEVLRGPQGTLFGSGSEGGTIRFIQPKPSLTDYSLMARAEYNKVGQDGDTGFEYGVAGGGPIIDGVLGFRASAYYRKTGGWIDETQGTLSFIDRSITSDASNVNRATAAIQFHPDGIVLNDANWTTSTALRLALAWSPVESVVITPSINYEDHYYNYQGGTFYVVASNPRSDAYVNLLAVPTVDATHVAIPDPLNEPADDQYLLPNLNMVWNINDDWSVTSNTGLMIRKQYGWGEYPSYETTYAKRYFVEAGDKADGIRSDNYDNLTQEVRAQFNDPNSWISATVGYYYGKFRQEANQYSISNYFHDLCSPAANPSGAACSVGTSTVITQGPLAGVTYPGGVYGGAPFGGTTSAWVNYFGQELPAVNKDTSPTPIPGAAAGNYPYTVSYYSHLITHQEQHALFAQADVKLPYDLTLTLGVRGSLISSSLVTQYGGATSNLYQPKGLPCVPGTGGPSQPACVAVTIGQYAPGTGPFQVAYPAGTATSFERAFTPKIGLSWQMDDDNMFYGTASRGFRPGGSQTRLNSGCDFQLIQLGYSAPSPTGTGVVANGPTQYGPDTVWNYEVGAKNRLFGGTVQFDTSAYLVTWRDIQTSVSISSCNQSLVDNLGGATAAGFDMMGQFRLMEGLNVGFTAGYNETSFTGNTILGGNKIYSAGSAIPSSGPPLRFSLFGRYDFMLKNIPFYLNGDFSFQSKTRRTGSTDPTAYNYDRNLLLDPAYTQTNIRVGFTYQDVDMSLFIRNLTDEAPYLSYGHTTSGSPVYTANTIQPRTVGVTLAFRD